MAPIFEVVDGSGRDMQEIAKKLGKKYKFAMLSNFGEAF
jgi:hypothetical protein